MDENVADLDQPGSMVVTGGPVIRRVDAYVVRHDLEPHEQFEYAQNRYNDRTVLLCRITTDSGHEGWGESFGPSLIHKTTIDSVYAPLVVGHSPFDSEVIWDTLYNTLRDHGQKGLAIEAQSAIDIALWDLKGKITGLPVWALMGGKHRDRVMPYATGLYRRGSKDELRLLVEEASQHVARGFRAMKLKLGFGLEYDLAAVKAIRAEIGDDIELYVDANHGYNASTAIDLGRRMEPYDIGWFEEPVPPEDIEGYREVKAALSMPIAGGEAEYTRFGFHRLLSARAVDIAQPDCTVTGGISEFQKIVTLATVHNIQCYPHVWGSAVALHAGLHCALALPEFPPRLYSADSRLELDQTANVFRDRLAGERVSMKDGFVIAPTKPGLGIEIDTDLIEHYQIA